MNGVDASVFIKLGNRVLIHPAITTEELYQRLKAKGVLVVPGHYFFPGLNEPWQHKDECIRITFAQSEGVVSQGLSIIAKEVRSLY